MRWIDHDWHYWTAGEPQGVLIVLGIVLLFWLGSRLSDRYSDKRRERDRVE